MSVIRVDELAALADGALPPGGVVRGDVLEAQLPHARAGTSN
jgi:hypothetical protein